MKAIVVSSFGGPEVLMLSDIPTPEPSDGEVCVKVDAAGVNPVDSYIRTGTYPVVPQLPYTPGFDGAGTIVAVGNDVIKWSVGDRVYMARSISGTYAAFSICRQEDVHALPDNISSDQGAAIGVPGAAAWRSLFIRGEAQPGQRLLVHGASGSVGLFAVQLGRLAGLHVYGTAGSKAGKSLVCKNGASDVFRHKDTDYRDRLLEASGGRGFDLILEMLANVNLEKDLELLAPGGRVVIVGSRGRVEIDPRLTMGKETDIRGMSLFAATPDEEIRTHAGLFGALSSGGVVPVVNSVQPLEKATEAHKQVLQDGNLGKIVLRP